MTTMKRLASLDALRGFDMFFITGGSGLIAGICSALGCGDGAVALQMKHPVWEGLTQHDTIFPLFLFLAGVSWPFSLAARRERGCSTARLYGKVGLRAVLLFFIGMCLAGFFKFQPTFRIMSVLGFIGVCWGLAAVLYMNVEKPWKRALLFAAIVLGFFAFQHFTVAPGAPAGADGYSKEWNLVRWLDLRLMPEHLMIPASVAAKKGVLAYEPQSPFTIPGGLLIALAGMFAGSLLRSARFAATRKAGLLALAGVGAIALFAVFKFALGVPLVKPLWTLSFDFFTIGYSFLMLSLFYWIVDVRGWTAWTVAFDPVGKNSILAYCLSMTGISWLLTRFFFDGLCEHWGGAWSSAVRGLGSYLVVWAILRYCQKKGVYLRV